jgi:serine/threonine-protein kinase HipA
MNNLIFSIKTSIIVVVMAASRLTLQIHFDNAWHDAAILEVESAALGTASPATLEYNASYFFDYGSEAFDAGHPSIDWRALSVRHQLDLSGVKLRTWPPFLLDLLPQGHGRRRLAEQMGLNPDSPSADFPLLLRGGGAPIGNIRVKEAWTAEQERIHGQEIRGVTIDEVFARSEAFRDMAERFALIASGSSGVQGEWPKILLAQSEDERWYPDSMVTDERAKAHVIVKMSRARFAEDRMILAAEAPYLEVARDFGLRVGDPLTYDRDTLVIPRFDRQKRGKQTIRLGQESLVAAAGVAEFGYVTTHERYIETLQNFCSDPATEIVEYVLRDVLNRAMGDTDNHGRNTALQKRPDGWIGLTPRFDFTPMILDPGMIAPSTTWNCLRGRPMGRRYEHICEAVVEVTGKPEIGARLRDALLDRAELVADLHHVAARHHVEPDVSNRACRYATEVAAELEALRN